MGQGQKAPVFSCFGVLSWNHKTCMSTGEAKEEPVTMLELICVLPVGDCKVSTYGTEKEGV